MVHGSLGETNNPIRHLGYSVVRRLSGEHRCLWEHLVCIQTRLGKWGLMWDLPWDRRPLS